MPWIISGILIIIAYLLGSIPTGYLVVRYAKGIDIRDYGSGSTGATNVLRTLGKGAAIAVLAIDALKGAIAVSLVKVYYSWVINPELPTNWYAWLIVGTALAAVIGHSKSIFLGFSGGKSVATSVGVLLVISPLVALATIGVFGVSLAISRIVSLSSISGAIAVNIFMYLLQPQIPYIIFAAIAGIYVIVRHYQNIQRILAGTEPKIGEKAEVSGNTNT